mgnify:CR=1 FL=1
MSEHPDTDQEQTFMQHLVELRGRLLKACLAIVVVMVCLLPFSRQLYQYLAGPLLAQMPLGSSMIAIDVASPFLAPFKLTMLLAGNTCAEDGFARLGLAPRPFNQQSLAYLG